MRCSKQNWTVPSTLWCFQVSSPPRDGQLVFYAVQVPPSLQKFWIHFKTVFRSAPFSHWECLNFNRLTSTFTRSRGTATINTNLVKPIILIKGYIAIMIKWNSVLSILRAALCTDEGFTRSLVQAISFFFTHIIHLWFKVYCTLIFCFVFGIPRTLVGKCPRARQRVRINFN